MTLTPSAPLDINGGRKALGDQHQPGLVGHSPASAIQSAAQFSVSHSPSSDSIFRQSLRGVQGPLSNAPSLASLADDSRPSTPQLVSTIRSSERRKQAKFIVKSGKELLTSVNSVVKNRTGAVLGRQTILKSDHFETGFNTELDFTLQGAPNFRMADLNIFGVAQPTVSGISTILRLLNCHPSTEGGDTSCIWFSSREEPLVYINRKPFVLREMEAPLKNIRRYQGISAPRLEAMEARLKEDVLREASRCNGLVLVHDEIEGGKIVPTWTAADIVETPKEVFQRFSADGCKVKYVRIPISPEQAPEDRYLDEYVSVIRNTNTTDALVFNCGMGVGRTTFAMVVAMLIRRAQILMMGKTDPLGLRSDSLSSSGTDKLEHMEEAETQNKAILRLVYILEKGLAGGVAPRSAVDWALARGALLDDLKNAVLGNYQVILQLASVLQSGSSCKKILDEVINRCDAMVNLREVVLLFRVQYSSSGDLAALEKALGCLERYFFLLAFASYVNEHLSSGFNMTFRDWIRSRSEIYRMLEHMRRKGPRLYMFRPIEDLTVLSDSGMKPGLVGWGRAPPTRPIANELEKYVIKSRQGTVLVPYTILKVDHWSKEVLSHSEIEGAPNFRKIPGLNIYGVAQPTIQGMKNVFRLLREDNPLNNHGNAISTQGRIPAKILWINLREEPLVYVNGVPYVLRDQYMTLRNIKSYSGITSARLELIEARLKEDVIAEISAYDEKILLHTETSDAQCIPVWEDCSSDNVLSPREVMEDVLKREGDPVAYYRVPVTAETPPDETDFDYLLQLLSKENLTDTAVVLNCQIGIGRSTTGTVVTTLVYNWLHGIKEIGSDPQSRPESQTPAVSELWKVTRESELGKPPLFPSSSGSAKSLQESDKTQSGSIERMQFPRMNYQIIHSLLRVIKNGLECKNMVDEVIDLCSQVTNLRDSIEQCRLQAEAVDETTNPQQHRRYIRKGLLYLKRYFLLIAFQAYLNETPTQSLGGEIETFKAWMDRHMEIVTMKEDLDSENINALVPVEHLSPGDGIALTTEVLDVVNRRNGAVLARQTIIKYDMFPGAQKLSLAERIEGAPNYRKIPLSAVQAAVAPPPSTPSSALVMDINFPTDFTARFQQTTSSVYGIAMPTKDAIRKVCSKIGVGPGSQKRLVWTSLREEPVIYVSGRPYVLRLFQDPMKNLEATGIVRERVEMMENQLKLDVINELRIYNGRVLLHEEEVVGGSFSIVPVWETVREEDVQTPLEVYKSIVQEGYNVDYLRIPITDEQAPIPDVFNELVDRLLSIDGSTDAMFNCQMGRGRTTTGMIITCLMQMIVGNDRIFSDMQYVIEDEEARATITDTPTANEEDTRARYVNGEYKIILQLISVLQYGKLSKRLTDKAIDLCDHMQNLRVAVYDFKMRVEALEPGTRKHKALCEVGLNYLVRYFYLITFADYLLEETTSLGRQNNSEEEGVFDFSEDVKPRITFSQWLHERREIGNIIRKSNQSLD
ncbi:hypothetical protein HK102_013370 [Quaeritorhiza haematococci]|nr:hypothetical protein HK102_013370 [Quaeritorhiza haematococci]